MFGERRHRLLRRLSSCLVIIGGVVLAYPFWSAGYAHVQQGRLSQGLRTSEIAFDRSMRADAAQLAAIKDPRKRLRRLAETFAADLRPGAAVGRLRIPRIGLDTVVLEGAHRPPSLGRGNDQGLLRSGPVHYGLTPLPGAGRPFAVAGHRTTFGAPFYRLDRLRPGDTISVVTPYARMVYRVAKTTVVRPSDVWVLSDHGYDLVLTTCHPPYSADHRLIVWAQLASFALR